MMAISTVSVAYNRGLAANRFECWVDMYHCQKDQIVIKL
jgi:hypothetical protein